jgi:hypothetical protein
VLEYIDLFLGSRERSLDTFKVKGSLGKFCLKPIIREKINSSG